MLRVMALSSPPQAGYQPPNNRLGPFDVIVLTDALTIRRGSWRLCYVMLGAALKNLNTGYERLPAVCQGSMSEKGRFPLSL
jgi:hypothetical protein